MIVTFVQEQIHIFSNYVFFRGYDFPISFPLKLFYTNFFNFPRLKERIKCCSSFSKLIPVKMFYPLDGDKLLSCFWMAIFIAVKGSAA